MKIEMCIWHFVVNFLSQFFNKFSILKFHPMTAKHIEKQQFCDYLFRKTSICAIQETMRPCPCLYENAKISRLHLMFILFIFGQSLSPPIHMFRCCCTDALFFLQFYFRHIKQFAGARLSGFMISWLQEDIEGLTID